MRLTRKQRNQINNLKGKTAKQIAQHLKIEPELVSDYLAEVESKKVETTDNWLPKFPQVSLTASIKTFVKKEKKRIYLLIFLIALAYLTGLPNGFVSDDLPLLRSPNLANPFLTFKTEPASAILNSISYTLNYYVGGTAPFGYHLVNLLLHLLLTLIIFYFLTLLVSSTIAFWASLIFAVHPLHSEAVFWISGRHYILYSIFLISALIGYLFYNFSGKKRSFLLASILLYLVSFFSFPQQAIGLPFFLILIDFCQKRLRENRRLYLIFFLIAIGLSALSLSSVVSRVSDLNGLPSGKINFLISDTVALATYLKLFLLPVNLSFYHENLSVPVIILVLMAISALAVCVLLPLLTIKKTRFFALAVGLFLISLLPTLTPLRVSWIVAERYTYLSLIGPSLLLAYVIHQIKQRSSPLSNYLIIGLTIVLMTLTALRGLDWKDEDSLWIATVKSSPDSSKAWNNIGDYYGRHGDPQKSLESFIRATQLNPTYADAWHNAGNVLFQMGKADQSIPYFEKSIEFNPSLIEGYNNLALAYFRKGDLTQARQLLQKSFEINNQNPKTYVTLAVIEYNLGNKQKAHEALTNAARLDPTDVGVQQSLRQLEKELGK